MDRGRILSLKRRIGAAESIELSELTEEVSALGPPVPEELVSAIVERLAKGTYITTDAVAHLVVSSRSRRVFEVARTQLLADIWGLIILVRAAIPDPSIERRLRDELYKIYRSNDDPRRSEILRALADYGSTDCLDDLEAIRYDLAPQLQTKRLTRDITGASERLDPSKDPQALLDAVTRRADIAFGERLVGAITQIRERATPSVSGWDASPATADPFVLARSYIHRARQHVERHDYGASLNYSRKALEALLKSFVREQRLNIKKDVPVEKLELPALVAAINSQVDLPKDIRMAIEAVQRDSTYGSHDQGVPPEEVLTTSIAQATIDKYFQVELHLTKIVSGGA